MQTTETETTELIRSKDDGLTAEEVLELVADAPAADAAAFVPTDAAGADWGAGEMADARSRAARIRENAEKMARAEERKAEHLNGSTARPLQAWLRNELAGGTRKSKRLFHGVLGFRAKPAAAVITDEAPRSPGRKWNCPKP